MSDPEPITIQLRPRGFVPWIVGALMVGLVYYFRDMGALLFAAFALAYVLHPLVDRLEGWRVPRSLAIALVLLFVGSAVTAILWFVVPDILKEITMLSSTLPRRIRDEWLPRSNQLLVHLRGRYHLRIPTTADAWMAQLGMRASEIAPRSVAALLSAANATISVLEFALEVLVVLAMSFYLLQDWHALLRNTVGLVPMRAREQFVSIASRVDATMGRFVRGQLLVMLLLGTIFAVGLSALNVPAGLGLGIMAGLISFVPYVGFIVALILSLMLALLDGGGTTHVLLVLGFMVFVHVLDVTLVTPRILGGSIGLPPIMVILSLLAGAKLMGFTGLLVAIPVAAMLRVIVSELVGYYRRTMFFRAPPAPPRTSVTDLRVSIPPEEEAP